MSEQRDYHHGNLRQTLIDAALACVEQQGYQNLSLRDIAQNVGVTRGAPYRHFKDRNALLTAVAVEGFNLLLRDHQLVAASTDSPAEKIKTSAGKFLQFAKIHPQLFLLMYDSGLLTSDELENDVSESMKTCYNLVYESYRALQPKADEKALKAQVVVFWATLYGYARLHQSRLLKPYMLEPLTEEDIIAAVINSTVPE